MNKVNWTAVAIFGIVLLFAFLIGISVLGGVGGYGSYGRGWGMMGPGMMGGWGFGPFGWIGMLLMWLVPTGFFVLVALGIVWLVRVVGQPSSHQQPPAAPAKTCPNCHRPVQAIGTIVRIVARPWDKICGYFDRDAAGHVPPRLPRYAETRASNSLLKSALAVLINTPRSFSSGSLAAAAVRVESKNRPATQPGGFYAVPSSLIHEYPIM